MKKKAIILFIIVLLIIKVSISFFSHIITNGLYQNRVMIPKYSYFLSYSIGLAAYPDFCCTESIELYTLKSMDDLNEYKKNNIENLVSCYDDSYFYDSKNNITYSKYEFTNKLFFNSINISYDRGNYCLNEFIIEDNWIAALTNGSSIKSNIDYEKLTMMLAGSNRLASAPVPFDDKYYVSYKYYDRTYTLYFTKYEENKLGIILVDQNDAKKYAIYEVNDSVDKILESL